MPAARTREGDDDDIGAYVDDPPPQKKGDLDLLYK